MDVAHVKDPGRPLRRVECWEIAADAIKGDHVLDQLHELCPVLAESLDNGFHITDRPGGHRE
jgi:hypothetical protein